jgi:hypothetical protein
MLTRFLTAGTALLLATPAMARPMSTLIVDNQWEAPVNVQVDGRFVGTLGGYDDAAFGVRPGFHTVQILSQNGTLLEQSNAWFTPRRSAFVNVDIPMTTMTVTNLGRAPLFISGPRAGLWVAPGQSQTATLPAGQLFLTASIAGPRGSLQTVDSQAVWAEPGRHNRTTFAFVPPPPRPVVHRPGHRPPPVRPTAYASTGHRHHRH